MLWFAADLPARLFALSASRGALFFDLSEADHAQQAEPAVSTKANE
jgi:hypothetical protein